MRDESTEPLDPKRLETLPQLSLAEAAWMAGITPDAFERFLSAANLSHLRTMPITELVRAGFTLLGQREAQLAMFRLQLATALQREKELIEVLHSKLTLDTTPFVASHPTPPPPTRPPASPPPLLQPKTKKRGKKK